MTRRTLVIVLAVAAVAVVAGDVARDAKVAFPGYYAAFGFGGAVAVIAVSRWLIAPLVWRPEPEASPCEPRPSPPESRSSPTESRSSPTEGRDG